MLRVRAHALTSFELFSHIKRADALHNDDAEVAQD